MRAIVLAAGYGTRLGSATRSTPKPMLDIHGRPLLRYILEHLASHGLKRIAMNVHFMPELIRGYFGDGGRFGLELTYSHEHTLLGTAGGARKMAEAIDDRQPLLIHYGDVLTDQDFGAMIDFHRRRRALATMLIHRRENSNSVVGLSGSVVTRFLERPSREERQTLDSPWVNSGICICQPEVIDMIPTGTSCDMARDILPKLVQTGRLHGFPLTGYRCAIDSPSRLEEARDAIRSGRCKSSPAGGQHPSSRAA